MSDEHHEIQAGPGESDDSASLPFSVFRPLPLPGLHPLTETQLGAEAEPVIHLQADTLPAFTLAQMANLIRRTTDLLALGRALELLERDENVGWTRTGALALTALDVPPFPPEELVVAASASPNNRVLHVSYENPYEIVVALIGATPAVVTAVVGLLTLLRADADRRDLRRRSKERSTVEERRQPPQTATQSRRRELARVLDVNVPAMALPDLRMALTSETEDGAADELALEVAALESLTTATAQALSMRKTGLTAEQYEQVLAHARSAQALQLLALMHADITPRMRKLRGTVTPDAQ